MLLRKISNVSRGCSAALVSHPCRLFAKYHISKLKNDDVTDARQVYAVHPTHLPHDLTKLSEDLQKCGIFSIRNKDCLYVVQDEHSFGNLLHGFSHDKA